MRTSVACLACVAWVAACAAPAGAGLPVPRPPAVPPDPQEMVRYAAEAGEGTWKKVAQPPEGLSSRELFTYALALCEAGRHPERIAPLLELAAKMQDRDPKSRGYGNFRWSWSHTSVMDYNAVEFCMQGGSLLWQRHRDKLSQAARERLREILDFAVEGCLRHKVRESYTNIALMNAQNLILLGEGLGKTEVADEGYARLDRVFKNTLANGICEYGSPTYYGVDLDCLLLIEAFARRESGLAQARALLELFWTDIALNYFPPSQRLAGPHSRDYDYLRGHGPLDTHLWAQGWIAGPPRGSIGAVFPTLGRWRPPARLYEMSATRFPRLVRQTWGAGPLQFRTHYLLPDVTLGSAAANYHNMDLPLTADLPGAADYLRCYFIPDARHDPYGKVKIPEGSGAHQKTLHLRPFWTAAQRKTDALGVVLYRDEQQTQTCRTLESHFVFPRQVDAICVGPEPISLKAGAQRTVPLGAAQVLAFRRGTAAVGVRVLAATAPGRDAQPAEATLVDDGNEHGALRLTVTHYQGAQPPTTVAGAMAAIWVRVGSALADDAAFRAWAAQFAAAKFTGHVDGRAGTLAFAAEGTDGPLSVKAAYPTGENAVVDPAPIRAVLDVDGDDVGRRILSGAAAALPAAKQRPESPVQ